MPDFTDKEFERLLESGDLPDIPAPTAPIDVDPQPSGEAAFAESTSSSDSSGQLIGKVAEVNDSLREIDSKLSKLTTLLRNVLEA